MVVSNAFRNQIQNRNFLSPVGFKFIVNRARKVSFFGNSMNIPGLNMGVSTQPTYLKDIPIPGDKVEFNDLKLRFLVDESLENYMEIQRWIRGIGYPENLQEIYDFQEENPAMDTQFKYQLNLYSDATLFVLTSNNTTNFQVKFRNIFPISISDLQFDATDSDIEYLTADVSFKYTIYDIVDNMGNTLHDI
jgi:hypothetical protein